MHIAASIPESVLDAARRPGVDPEASKSALEAELLKATRSAFPLESVHIRFADVDRTQIRLRAAAPGHEPDALEQLLQVDARAPKIRERLRRLFGNVYGDQSWLVPAQATASADRSYGGLA